MSYVLSLTPAQTKDDLVKSVCVSLLASSSLGGAEIAASNAGVNHSWNGTAVDIAHYTGSSRAYALVLGNIYGCGHERAIALVADGTCRSTRVIARLHAGVKADVGITTAG